MPLSIDVGLSRKIARRFQSTGVSINITAELDQGLLARPGDLHAEIERLYAQAQEALEQQLAVMMTHAPSTSPAEVRDRPATPAQRRAIQALCRRLGVDAADAIRSALGCAMADMSVGQASQLIAQLEHQEHAAAADPGGNGRGD